MKYIYLISAIILFTLSILVKRFEDGLNKQWLRNLLINSKDSNIDLYDNTKQEIEEYIFNKEEKYIICYKSAYVNKYFAYTVSKLEKELETVVSCGKLTIFYK